MSLQLHETIDRAHVVAPPECARPEFLEELQETVPFWTRRHLVKPGIRNVRMER